MQYKIQKNKKRKEDIMLKCPNCDEEVSVYSKIKNNKCIGVYCIVCDSFITDSIYKTYFEM